MKRRKLSKQGSKKLFSKTARKIHKANLPSWKSRRGGGRL